MPSAQPSAFFQPFIDTATGRIAGVEALGRLRQADGSHTSVGPLFADPHTPTADLLHLDRTLREDALQRFASAPEDWFLSLNLSPRWISQVESGADLPSLVQLERSGVAPSRVVYEITEAAGDLPRLTEAVARYRERGIRIAIDDFGSGYSQLDRVLDLQPDILKLDMRLFQAAARGGPRGDAVKALAQMAEKTGCWLIAEGVETETELDFALECGSRYVQGFLFAQATYELSTSDRYQERFAALRRPPERPARSPRLSRPAAHLPMRPRRHPDHPQPGMERHVLAREPALPQPQLVLASLLLCTAGRGLERAPVGALDGVSRCHDQPVLPDRQPVPGKRSAPAADRPGRQPTAGFCQLRGDDRMLPRSERRSAER